MGIAENLQEVIDNIKTTASACGRSPEEIQLVAVSKRFPTSAIQEAIAAGHTVFGENYIQEAESKAIELGDTWHVHFIGHLQSNKAKIAARIFDLIETVDSLKLAKKLNNELVKLDKTLKILLQVNIGADEHKSGVTPETAAELLRQVNELSNIQTVGLMTMPPFTDDPEDARPHFRKLRQLAEELDQQGLFLHNSPIQLSMGMSHDYHVAIQEGATIIRIGTAIFGQRQ